MFYFMILFFGFLLMLSRKKTRNFNLFWGLLLFVAIFRYGIGSDFFAYEYLYSRISLSPLNEFFYGIDNQEVGFRVITSFFKKLNMGYYLYIAIIASLNLVYLRKICRKYSVSPIMSLVIYFSFYYLTWTFSALRQGLVVLVGMFYLIEYSRKKASVFNVTKFFAIIILLMLFHSSALILLPYYILMKLNLKKTHLIILTNLGLFFSVLPIGRVLYLLSSIPFLSKIIHYINLSSNLNSIFDFQTLSRLFLMLIAFLFYDSIVKNNFESKSILDVYIFSFFIYFIFKSSELVAARLSIYGRMLDILIFPIIYYSYKDKFSKLLITFILVSLCTLYLSKDLVAINSRWDISNHNGLLPPYINHLNKNNYIFNHRYNIE